MYSSLVFRSSCEEMEASGYRQDLEENYLENYVSIFEK
jgi:hypothetical protein